MLVATLTPDPAISAARRSQRRACVPWMWLGNVLLGTLIGLAYLREAPLHASLRLWMFEHLGLLSAIGTTSLIPGAIPWLLARTRIGERSFAIVQALVWMFFQVALVVDTRLWELFRYHFNSSAWNLITSHGSEDSYRLGWKVWGFGFGIGMAVFALEALAWRLLRARKQGVVAARRWLQPALLCTVALALVICVEKSIYAQADLTHDREVAEASQAFPMYPRLTLKPFLTQALQDQIDVVPDVRIGIEDAQLDYPHARPHIDPHGRRPNILMLVIDSWRRDMLREDVTPNIVRIAGECRRFDDHLSGGNGTRFGVFSMLYGLPGCYWWPVLQAHRAPVLLDELRELGYDTQVFSAASMDYPEFRSTAWIDIPERVHDQFGEPLPGKRDLPAVEACLDWWHTRDASKPFFGFVLLDSSHQKYDFPAESAPFTPYAQDVDYLELAGSRDPALIESVRNRYMNALHHADSLVLSLVNELRTRGELDNTILIITGDHGEEFAEHGYWGHTGNFTLEQVAVPLLMRGPGIAVGVERRPTSHLDLAATLLEMLGADPLQRAQWCTSENLFAPPAERARVVVGWEELGLWTSSGIFRVPRDRDKSFGAIVCDADWQLAADQRTPFMTQARELARLSRDCERFLSARDPRLAGESH